MTAPVDRDSDAATAAIIRYGDRPLAACRRCTRRHQVAARDWPGRPSMRRSMRSTNGAAVGAAVEVADHELGLGRGHDPRPDRPPQVAQRPAHDALGGRAVGQAAPGLGGVEVDVPALLAGDAPRQLGQHRVVGALGEAGVGGLVVHSLTAPHVMCRATSRSPTSTEPSCDTYGRMRSRSRGAGAAGRRAARARRPAVGGEHVAERLAVPQLLVGPAAEERGHVGVGVGRRHEEVAQVADRVQLDVVHVLDGPQRVGVERLGRGRRRGRGRPSAAGRSGAL